LTNYRLLTPPDEIEEIYPYRRVWWSLALESGILFGAAAVLYIAFSFLSVRLPEAVLQPLNVLLALLPAGLWLVFSVWRERSATEPRRRLLFVALITALVANAIALPFLDHVLQPDRWLSLANATNRIIGYTFTVGIIQEVLKYVVVRYLAWDTEYRVRLDSVAYTLASAIGYSTVLNLSFVLNNVVTPDVAIIQIVNYVTLNFVGSLIAAYGLAEVRFDNPNPFLLTSMIALAALLNGAVIPLRSGLVNAGFSLVGSTPGVAFGLVVSIGVLVAVAFVVSFLFNAAERRAREAAAREV
jgi:RsiW-degrading membrane proteinase PrsW (M82 family)